jgi:Regulator of chromosome condensation (RCC1) repeat/Secretion system C-terminal sorting domain
MNAVYKTICVLLLGGSINSAKAQCWQSVKAGGGHTFAIKQGGTLWAWGFNSHGQLGDGTLIDKNTPTQIGTSSNWQSISGGERHSLAIKQDGTLWAWGNNEYGQLGDGTLINKSTPVQIGTATNWQSISGGSYQSFALKQDGTLWAWGYNAFGQLGDGTNTNKNAPTQIGTATNWQSIAGEYFHTLAIKQDGSLWAWGNNFSGQLGDGTNTDKNAPIQIGIATNWQSISGGEEYSLAIKQNGTIWAWGMNFFGELGDGTNNDKFIPTQIGTTSNWQSISTGAWHSLAVNQSGTLWAWGENLFGQLGDSTFTDKNIPTQIGGSCSILPIKLISFTASLQNFNNAKLQWQIATAEDGCKYELLRSTDGRNFLPINLQTGNSTITQFGYTDNTLPNGTYYYRLKMMDKDGKVSYSNVAIVKVGSKEQLIAVYPNPVKRGESLQLSLQNITANKIEIINVLGQVVYNNTTKQTGSIGISISSELAPGQYVVRIVSDTKADVQKILIQ